MLRGASLRYPGHTRGNRSVADTQFEVVFRNGKSPATEASAVTATALFLTRGMHLLREDRKAHQGTHHTVCVKR